ncbi:hypothetical protein M758_4G147200 [Ceratodon purpureus]|nr:hypothetical protein M758_4G147200 [Ceratodon purpureus]
MTIPNPPNFLPFPATPEEPPAKAPPHKVSWADIRQSGVNGKAKAHRVRSEDPTPPAAGFRPFALSPFPHATALPFPCGHHPSIAGPTSSNVKPSPQTPSPQPPPQQLPLQPSYSTASSPLFPFMIHQAHVIIIRLCRQLTHSDCQTSGAQIMVVSFWLRESMRDDPATILSIQSGVNQYWAV